MLGQFAIDPESGKISGRQLLYWWRQGLLGCLPGWLRRRIDPLASPFVLTVFPQHARMVREGGNQPIKVEFASRQEMLEYRRLAIMLKGRSQSLVIKAPTEWVLLRRVTLPAATLENLRQVLGFEMDRVTPFTLDQVWYDHRILPRERGSEEVTAEVAILPRSRLNQWTTALGEIGATPAVITAPGLWPELNFVPEEERPRGGAVQRAYAAGIAAVFVALLGAALALPLWQRQQIMAGLEARTDRAKREAGAVVNIRDRVDEARKLLEFIPEKRRTSRPVAELLDEITGLLPDHTWLQQLELNGGKLELRGMSAQASALIGVLEKTEGFSEVAFRSPVVGAEGAERFHLGVKLLEPGQADTEEAK